MTDGSGELTARDLLAVAAAAGFGIQDHNLGYWHRKGLLPPPRQQGLGYGRGSESRYPPGTDQQLRALLQIHRKTRKVAVVGWELWWQGFPVPEALVRESLLVAARKFQAAVAMVRDPITGAISAQVLDALDTKHWHLPAPLAARARTLPRGYAESMVEMILDVLSGTYSGLPEIPGQPNQRQAVFEQFLGLTRARTDALVEHEPWLGPDDNVDEAIGELAQLLGKTDWEEVVRTTAWSRLEEARDQAASFAQGMTLFSTIADKAFGKGAFGFSVLRKLLPRMLRNPMAQAVTLLLWCVMGDHPQILEGQRAYAVATRDTGDVLRRMQAIREALADRFPDIQDLLDPVTVLRSQKDAASREAHASQLATFRQAHAEDLDRFFQEHPELRQPETPDDRSSSRSDPAASN